MARLKKKKPGKTRRRTYFIQSSAVWYYSETCEIRTPLGPAKSVPIQRCPLFHRAICTENTSLGPDETSLFHRMSSFRRVAIHRFHCITTPTAIVLWVTIIAAIPDISTNLPWRSRRSWQKCDSLDPWGPTPTVPERICQTQQIFITHLPNTQVLQVTELFMSAKSYICCLFVHVGKGHRALTLFISA
jgi:hypothetical protein